MLCIQESDYFVTFVITMLYWELTWKNMLSQSIKAQHFQVTQYSVQTSRLHYLKYPCDLCDYTWPTKHTLKLHIEEKQLGLGHFCDICDSKFKLKSDLNMHIKGYTRKIQCYVIFVNTLLVPKFKLNAINRLKHDGVRFPCKTCH